MENTVVLLLENIFVFLLLLSILFFVISILFPKAGLWFSIPAQQTRLHGGGFWFLSALFFMIATGFVFEMEKEMSDNEEII